MEWNGPNQGKLRKALLEICVGSDIQSLRLFIRDRFDYPLDDVGGDSREIWAGALIEKFAQEGFVNELYQKICKDYAKHSAIEKLQSELRGNPLVKKEQKVEASSLFDKFSPYDDFAAVQTSFLCAFKLIYGDFLEIRPEHPPLNTLDQIQSLIEAYGPKLAVQFAEHLFVELNESNSETRLDLKNTVESWRDRIAQSYSITPEVLQPAKLEQQGYLLVALKESARITGTIADVTVFSELHITDEKEPVEFGANVVTCSIDEVATHLSALIHQAESALSAYGCGRVTIELFLPCEHLDINVADWEILNKRGKPRLLGKHRSFVIRSYDRAKPDYRATQSEVKRKWQFLQACVKQGNACDRFYPQETPLAVGDLEDKLKDKPGLKLIAELPKDRDDYLDILDDIIESGVPIALWFSTVEGLTTAEKLTEFNMLLQACGCLTDFSHLANQWRTQRPNYPNQHLRVLCDCPDRWPAKPFCTDPLVAS